MKKSIIKLFVVTFTFFGILLPSFAVFASPARPVTQDEYAEQYYYKEWKKTAKYQHIKQPDAQIVQLGKTGDVEAFESTHCMQAALMSNGLVVPIPCGHIVGEYMHALTTYDGLLITGYITSKEYKSWRN